MDKTSKTVIGYVVTFIARCGAFGRTARRPVRVDLSDNSVHVFWDISGTWIACSNPMLTKRLLKIAAAEYRLANSL